MVIFRRLLVVVSIVFAAHPALAAAPSEVTRHADAEARGQVIEAAGTAARAEVVTFGTSLAERLRGTPPGQRVRVAGWPVAPGERADVVLTRHEVYAPGARVFKVQAGKTTEVPRSRLAFLWGEAENDADQRVFVAVDPDVDRFDGFALSPHAVHELHPLRDAGLGAAAADGQYLLAPPETFLEKAGQRPEWSCGTTGVPLDVLLNQHAADTAAAAGAAGDPLAAITTSATLRNATVAFDTDNELMANKFANNTTTATSYIASLVAQMNVIYQRDLQIQLVQGTTFLRVSTTADPYSQPSTGGAGPDQLSEFSNYWSANYGSVSRTVAAMLSGKGSSNGGSGIAWIDSLCSTGYGYSFSQVFLSGTTVSFGDVLIVAHEIGHNFGSPHTHCYSPPIDTCYNGEAANGCFAGTPSCPAPATVNGLPNVTGTLMSYCHLLGGCSSSLVFHPRTVSLLTPKIQAAACIASALSVTGVAPQSGATTGGTAVTITGGGFVSGATVSFGGAAATSVVVVNATTITAHVPAHATGPVTVTVTNPDTASAPLANSFFYAPPPAVTDFYTLPPCRVVDTRLANGPLGGPQLGASAQRVFPVAGSCGIPAAAKAIAANVTAYNPAAAGTFSLYPGNAFPLGTYALGFTAGANRADGSVLPLATDGSGSLGVQNASGGATHLILDVFGYFQ